MIVQSLQDIPSNLPFHVGFSTMDDGNMSFRVGQQGNVYGNRVRFFEKEGIPAERMATFFTEHQDHITEMDTFPAHLDALKGQRLAITDAIITRIPQTGVFLTFADCVPFIVYDQRQHLMAFAHIGWRSMAMRFTRTLLHYLQERHHAQAQDCIAVIGPCIKKESYLFANPIQAQHAAWQPYLVPQTDGRMGIDLVGFCQAECQTFGLGNHQIFTETMDTASHPNQFSHYMGTEGSQPHKQGRLICYGFLH